MGKTFSLGFLLIGALLISSCARKLNFGTSTVVPAATGNVKIKKDNNDNYIISVKIDNLVKARDLVPPRDVYVVWMETETGTPKNIGQINPSTRLFSKKMKASLKATATARPTRIFVTAEDYANIQYPGMQVVLRTEYN
jgi:hypothetical protein